MKVINNYTTELVTSVTSTTKVTVTIIALVLFLFVQSVYSLSMMNADERYKEENKGKYGLSGIYLVYSIVIALALIYGKFFAKKSM